MEIREGLAIGLDFGQGAGIVAQVIVDEGALLFVDGVECVDGQQFLDVGGPAIAHAGPRFESSLSVSVTFNDARRVRNPDRMRLFTVPSG